jgi:putative chitinase
LRWAAYGPGPYGGYGYSVGYSGDSGAGGGVGEDYTDEGWKDWVAGATLGAAALGVQAKPIIVQQHVEPGDTVYSIARQNNVDPKEIMKLNNFNINTKLKPGQMVKVPDYSKPVSTKSNQQQKIKPDYSQKKVNVSNTVTGTNEEALLRMYANKANIKGNELIAFLSQVAHETMNFKHMVEIGGSHDFKKYDPNYAPGKARQLGNIKPGDGEKYKGRGFIQITGRYNYAKAGEALNLPLEQKPELVERPDIAAKVAIWYWKNRVKPNVDNFKDVKDVTKPINPGLKGLEDRKEKFKQFMVAMK